MRAPLRPRCVSSLGTLLHDRPIVRLLIRGRFRHKVVRKFLLIRGILGAGPCSGACGQAQVPRLGVLGLVSYRPQLLAHHPHLCRVRWHPVRHAPHCPQAGPSSELGAESVRLLTATARRLTNELCVSLFRPNGVTPETIGNMWYLSANADIANFTTGYQFVAIGVFVLMFPANLLLRRAAAWSGGPR